MTEPSTRSLLLDAARGLAVVAMVAFHLVWDLGNFGYVDPAFPFSPGVKLSGHLIAESFLFIAGVSLVLAHDRQTNWRPFWRRIAVVAGAAALVSAGTYLVFPQAFVFFGILHCIALASLLAAPLLSAPWSFAAAAAALATLAPALFVSHVFNAPAFWWTGFSTFEPLTNDYRPIMPWSAGLFAGVAAARLSETRDWSTPTVDRGLGPLPWLGRHSLTIYLLHQPLLFVIFTGIAALTSTQRAENLDVYLASCEAQCAGAGGKPDVCARTCACTTQRATVDPPPNDPDIRAVWIDEAARECLARTQ
jgi:uncharacterized membrane protein